MVKINQTGFNYLSDTAFGPMIYNKNDLYIGRSLELYGEYSFGEYALFSQIVTPEMVVVEIGANIGSLTVGLAQLANQGAVYAFEPQRIVFQTLCANIALNSLINVFAYQYAVGSRNGSTEVPALDPHVQNNFGGLELAPGKRGESVPLTTIDRMNFQRLDFLKMDIEGMECEALKGATKTIRRFRPIIYVEADRQERFAELYTILSGHRYRMYWSLVNLYRPDNFRGVAENIFQISSKNLLCIPEERDITVTDMPPVTGPDDSPEAAVNRANYCAVQPPSIV
ncbi:MAG: FkbM family methyltransferase [Tsuneonella suprasediminis]|uniref:FkbM family methyltransferase n=1 Tax=Tsuneonella suprasediminis TaxID=2306996 RepID=A0A419QZA5_9SPHN|nr:FkbM family methyltransferase [Tsuneonella suprasediminis]RJX66309.1 FkbM family methyltransferase [Tsuneonella suprasediminis]UBS32018.1 FkbM family methyltransferase [Altererythrobacter sp. N1]